MCGKIQVIEVVSEDGSVFGLLPRKAAHLYNSLHQGIGVLVERPEDGALFVHQRSVTKHIFPGLFDMFVGGVSSAGESPLTTARRELSEELNVHATTNHQAVGSRAAPLEHLFDCAVTTSLNRCRVSVFRCKCGPAAAAAMAFQESEVAGGNWESRKAVDKAAALSWQVHVLKHEQHMSTPNPPLEFVPDGLAVWNAFVDWEAH